MSYRNPGFRRSIIFLFASILILTTSAVLTYASDGSFSLNQPGPEWVRNLPAAACPWSSTDTYCHRSSPAVADITGNGEMDIVVATNNGHVLAVTHNGSVLWKTDVGPAFGMGSGKQRISSSPAVADIDNDGKMEVVVGTGTIYGSICTVGGVIVLDHNGRVEQGWPFITEDFGIPPSGCPDTVYATPALGDLDKDGDLEVVFSSFDKRVYALHHNGQLVAGFPPNSNHFERFGWPILKGRLADTIWSSPSLADVNADGYPEIVIGGDEGNFDPSWQPAVGDWNCPYVEPTTAGYCGGSIYAFDRFGRQLDGFPVYKHETIQSSPAIMQIGSDGQFGIFVGTGSWYYQTSPDRPTLGFRLFGMDSSGNDLPGWTGGKVVGGFVAASPSIGDITGNGEPNIVVAASDRRLYAWHMNGEAVAGFPMTPLFHTGSAVDGYNTGTSFILADYTGDGEMEIFLRHAWEIIIVNGKGQQLTATNRNDSKPVYKTDGTIMNNPTVADLDGDGHLELVVQNSQLTVWDLPSSSDRADWPMFKNNAARTSFLQPGGRIAPQEYFLFMEQGEESNISQQLKIDLLFGEFDWRVSTDKTDIISFSQNRGVGQNQQMVTVNFTIPAGLPLGENDIGNIKVEITQSNGFELTKNIPVRVMVMRELHLMFLPTTD